MQCYTLEYSVTMQCYTLEYSVTMQCYTLEYSVTMQCYTLEYSLITQSVYEVIIRLQGKLNVNKRPLLKKVSKKYN